MHRSFIYAAAIQDPFRILGVTRAATKSEIKSKYRELARLHHPDTNSGESSKMEEINLAYKTLMKDGGYERLRIVRNNISSQNPNSDRKSDRIYSEEIFYKSAPFTAEHQHSFSSYLSRSKSHFGTPVNETLSDEEAARLSALDPSTERRTPHGTFVYQNRDNESWVELKKPLFKAEQPRYKGFEATADMAAELQRRAIESEQDQLERSRFERIIYNLVNGGELPSAKRSIIFLYFGICVLSAFLLYRMQFASKNDFSSRKQFYQQVNDERDNLLQMMIDDKDSLELAVAAASVIYLAVSLKKNLDDPIEPVTNEVFYHVVRPPPEHFTVYSRVESL